MRFFLFAAALLSALAVQASTQSVEIEPGLTGEWVTPEASWDGRSVLLLHGLADDMDGPNDLSKRMALDLVKHGIATLRINFHGEGDRKRTHIESTFATRIHDAEVSALFMNRLAGVDTKRTGVLGFSLGSSTAMAVGARHPQQFASMVVLVAPGGDLFHVLALEGELKPTYEEARVKGWATIDAGWKKFDLSKEFFESFQGYHTDALLAAYPGAFLSIRGSNDFLPQADAGFMKVVKGRPAETLLIAGANHIFNTFEPELGLDARAMEAVTSWFVRTLK